MCIADTEKIAPSSVEVALFSWFLTKNRIFFIILLSSLSFSFSIPSFAQKPQYDEVLVTLKVQYVGTIELSTLINDNQEIYFSLPEVLDFLQIKNEVSDDYSIIDGFFIKQNNIFHVDDNTHVINYKGKATQLLTHDLVRTTTNLFLKASYFNSIFTLENTFSFRSLSVSMTSNLELPAVRQARLKLMRDNIKSIKYGFEADTTFKRNKPLFHFSTADWAVNTTQRSNGINQQQLRLGLGGMIAGGELTSSFNYGNNQPISSRNQYYRWRYVDNDNKYVTQISAGKIATPLTATILNPIIGVQFTNATTTAKRSFGTYVLSDYTKPDWTVELYINNILVDYAKADANGFFSFTVPLLYGKTDVSVRYYGPWGEEELSTKQFMIPFYFLPKHKLDYNVSSGIIEDGENSLFANAKASYGLSDYITVVAGLEYVSSIEKNKVIPYIGSSMRLANQLFVSGSYFSKVKYTGNLNYSTPKNIRLDLDYTKYNKNQDAVRFSYSESRKASLNIPIRTSHFSGVSRFTLQQTVFATSSFTQSELALSGRLYRFNFNLTTSSFFTDTTKPFVFSNLSSSFRLPKGFSLTPNIRYDYNRAEITAVQAQLRKRIFRKGSLQASFNHDFRNKNTSIQLGFQYNLQYANAGVSSNMDNNGVSFTQSASGSLIYEPNADFVAFNTGTSIGRASVKFVPYLDINGNKKRDFDEQPVKGLEVALNGGRKIMDKSEGTTIITGLEPYVKHFVSFNTAKINNIAWRLENKTLNITLNPNLLRTIEIPVSVVGEVAGMVQRNENGQLLGIGGLKVNIYRNDGDFIASVLSESDGYFGYLGLTSGYYSAKIDSVQLQKLRLRAESKNTSFIVDNGSDGAFLDNLEFVLYPD
jgi:hypothetical protein